VWSPVAKETSVVNIAPGAIFTKINFVRIIDSKNKSVTLHEACKAFQGQNT
jgi:hypothetical protein